MAHTDVIIVIIIITMPAPHHSIFMSRILLLMSSQPYRSTEGNYITTIPTGQTDYHTDGKLRAFIAQVKCLHVIFNFVNSRESKL